MVLIPSNADKSSVLLQQMKHLPFLLPPWSLPKPWPLPPHLPDLGVEPSALESLKDPEDELSHAF